MFRRGKLLATWLGLLCIVAAVVAGSQDPGTQDDREEPMVFTNDDLPPPLETGGSPSPADTPLPPAAPDAPAVAAFEDYRDNNGHGEGWWRMRAAELDLRVYEAWMRAQELHVKFVRGKEIIDPTLKKRSRDATEVYLELEAERDRLPEELRQAGGLPGWLRRERQALPDRLLAAPAAAAPVHAEELILSWEPVPQAGFYIVEAQCSDCCATMLGDCDVKSLDVSRPTARFPFGGGSSGRWRVRALDAAGFPGAWSDWQEFGPGTGEDR